MVESSPSSSSFSQRCRLRWLYESPSLSPSVVGVVGVEAAELLAQGLSGSHCSGLKKPLLSLHGDEGRQENTLTAGYNGGTVKEGVWAEPRDHAVHIGDLLIIKERGRANSRVSLHGYSRLQGPKRCTTTYK